MKSSVNRVVVEQNAQEALVEAYLGKIPNF
jgi:hypothetical protein